MIAGKVTVDTARQILSELGVERDLSGKRYGSGWIGRHGVMGKPHVEEQYNLPDGRTIEIGWTWGLCCAWIITPEMKAHLKKSPRNVRNETAFN